MKSLTFGVLVAAACLPLTTAPAYAQGWGLRGGANVNPDQLYVGGSYELGPLMEDVWLQPSGDAGFGNGVRLLAANVDVVYRLWQPRRSPWRLDVGGGPAVNHYRLGTYSQTEAGVNAVVALVHSSGWGSEFRIGFLDSPEFRVGVAYRLRPRPQRSGRR